MHGVEICHLDWNNSFVNIIIKLQPHLSTTAILGTKESDGDRETGWPSGLRVGLAIRRSWVRVPLWPLAGFVLGRPEFKSSATTGWLLPVGVLNPRMLYLDYLFSKYLLIVKRFGSLRERRYISVCYYYYYYYYYDSCREVAISRSLTVYLILQQREKRRLIYCIWFEQLFL